MNKFLIVLLHLGLIYFISGAGGFVISGMFARYQVTLGASGANMGILSALVCIIGKNYYSFLQTILSNALYCHNTGTVFPYN